MKRVYLPNLRKIVVNNYSLYTQNPTFEFSFKEGISAVVGANGIGKTTFVNMIIYALIGFRDEESKSRKVNSIRDATLKDINFFKDRMNYNFDSGINELASVELEYSLGNVNIHIQRSLFKDEIQELIINDKNIENADNKDYKQIICQYSGLTDFDDFGKIVSEFLFFDERRRNIAWEVDMQDYLLKVLLFDEEYFVKFKDLEDKIIQEDTKGRHKSEERRIAEESYEELIKAQKELIDEIKVGTNVEQEEKLDKEQLKIKRNNITGKIDNLAYDISLIQEDLDSLILDLNNIEGELTASSVKCDVIKEEIRKKEASLYKSIYSKMPDYYYTLEKNLLSDGKCLVCNSKSNNLKIEAIRKKNNNECFICSSKLSTVEKFSNKDIEILNELNLQKEKQENRNQNLLSRLNDLTNKVNEVKQKQYTKKTELDSLQKQMIIIENEIDRTDDNYKTDTYNEILKNKEKIIERLGQESKEAYAKRDEYKNDLNSYTQKFKSLMSHLTVELSSYFNKYASTFIGLDCELTVSEKVIRKIPHIVYIPKIANQIRKDIWSVSESQRFFLDQAFRMAIIDYLQKNISDFSSFFITETPEGSLDAAYENQVAEMFSIFAQSDNKIIFTSNLNSSNFLYDIFSRLNREERPLRILNMLEKGNLTRVQKKSLDKLSDILDNIMEG